MDQARVPETATPGRASGDVQGIGNARADEMLVLTRKLMEKLYIGNDVCVTVVRLEGGQVRLGIDAPREIAVVRAELLDGRPAVPADENGDGPDPIPPTPMSIKTRQGEARGIDIRRRGRSR